MRLEVLLEGSSDSPTVREILVRRFGLSEGIDFRLHPHHGKGTLPSDVLSPPPVHRRGLLDQLPAKLRGYSHLGNDACVLVLVDADQEPCVELLNKLNTMLTRLPRRPRKVLFRIAIEETESWFIADPDAVCRGYPKARSSASRLRRIPPDATVGAWEQLATALGVPPREVNGVTKAEWASRIAPHLNLDEPCSPSLAKFIEGVQRTLSNETRHQ